MSHPQAACLTLLSLSLTVASRASSYLSSCHIHKRKPKRPPSILHNRLVQGGVCVLVLVMLFWWVAPSRGWSPARASVVDFDARLLLALYLPTDICTSLIPTYHYYTVHKASLNVIGNCITHFWVASGRMCLSHTRIGRDGIYHRDIPARWHVCSSVWRAKKSVLEYNNSSYAVSR